MASIAGCVSPLAGANGQLSVDWVVCNGAEEQRL